MRRGVQEPQERVGFGCGRDRFAADEVRLRLHERIPAGPVELPQAGLPQVVVGCILRSVGQVGAVWSDAGLHQRFQAPLSSGRIVPEGVPDPLGDGDGEAEQIPCLRFRQTPPGEAWNRGLVGGGGDAVGSRVQVRQVDLSQQLGVVQKDPGGPELVVHVEAHGLQRGGQAPVQDHHALVVEKGPDRIGGHGALEIGRVRQVGPPPPGTLISSPR